MRVDFDEVLKKVSELTPIQRVGNIYIKRDDLFNIFGVSGGKARGAYLIIAKALKKYPITGVITAGSRHSPQCVISAEICKGMGIKARVHMPSGEYTDEMVRIRQTGAEIIQHKPGYNTVIVSRAYEDSMLNHDYLHIPFGMKGKLDHILINAEQVRNIPSDCKRIVMIGGSGVSLSAVLHGLKKYNIDLKVLAIRVGADIVKNLDELAPLGWRNRVEIVQSDLDYGDRIRNCFIGDIELDEVYEAKALQYLEDGDLFWIVGKR